MLFFTLFQVLANCEAARHAGHDWLTRLAWLAFYTHSTSPHFTILSTYADDTQIFYAEDNVKDVEQAMN